MNFLHILSTFSSFWPLPRTWQFDLPFIPLGSPWNDEEVKATNRGYHIQCLAWSEPSNLSISVGSPPRVSCWRLGSGSDLKKSLFWLGVWWLSFILNCRMRRRLSIYVSPCHSFLQRRCMTIIPCSILEISHEHICDVGVALLRYLPILSNVWTCWEHAAQGYACMSPTRACKCTVISKTRPCCLVLDGEP